MPQVLRAKTYNAAGSCLNRPRATYHRGMDNSARFHGYLKEFLQIMQDLHIAALGGISWEVPIAFSPS
jgi:hypothetical protein